MSRLPGVHCALAADPIPALDAATSIHLYRIAQEAINNALRHGGAKTIRFTLNAENDGWTLTISDDGTGFVAAEPRSGMGQRLMQYRADTIGATLDVHSDGTGVRVICHGGPRG